MKKRPGFGSGVEVARLPPENEIGGEGEARRGMLAQLTEFVHQKQKAPGNKRHAHDAQECGENSLDATDVEPPEAVEDRALVRRQDLRYEEA